MHPNVQLAIGFVVFVVAQASTQGLMPDTWAARWVVLICGCLSLFMQQMGLKTMPERGKAPDSSQQIVVVNNAAGPEGVDPAANPSLLNRKKDS